MDTLKMLKSYDAWLLLTFMMAMGLIQTCLVHIWEIYIEKLKDLWEIPLTRSIVELEKCDFIKHGLQFRQKLIGIIIRVQLQYLNAKSSIKH